MTIDRVRWEELYRRAFPDVYRAVLATVLDPDIALDAVHDAFEVGLRHPPESDANLPGWLFRVAVRRALRVRLRRPPISAGAAHADEFERALDRVESARLLKVLTARQRAVVVAHYFLGLRQEEVGQLLGMRRGTVGSTIAHALARMRKESARV
jgi:RNA polymerase sigma-70 factor, ECF subfamily